MGKILRERIKQTHFASAFQEASLNLLVTADFIKHETEVICQKHGITATQYNVLRILRGVYPEGHSRREILNRMLERSPDATRLISRLEERGLVERLNTPEDRRLSITRITEEGLSILAGMQLEIDGLNRLLSQSISESEAVELSRICEKIYNTTP